MKILQAIRDAAAANGVEKLLEEKLAFTCYACQGAVPVEDDGTYTPHVVTKLEPGRPAQVAICAASGARLPAVDLEQQRERAANIDAVIETQTQLMRDTLQAINNLVVVSKAGAR